MVNRIQTLRSSSQGTRPTGRSPGELYVNFPDNALGVVNAAGTATDLVAVRFFSTGANYVVGDYVVNAGNLYRAIATSAPGAFNAANWSKVTSLADTAAYLPLAGGTMTGLLLLSADPSALLGAATKQYVDAADALKANIASPTFTGDPKAPTPTAGDSDTSIATTAFVTTADNLKVNKAGDTMTGNLTINPAAGAAYVHINPAGAQQALVNCYQTGVLKWQFGKNTDDSFMMYDSVAAAMVFSIPSNGTVVTFSRAVSVPANSVAVTPTAGDSSTKIATTAFVATSFAPIAAPTFTGDARAVTPALSDADTSIATTAFVRTGVSDGSNAAAGQVGEFLTANSSSGAMTSSTPTNAAALALTAGDWDVTGAATVTFSSGGTQSFVAINTVSATLPAAGNNSGLQLTAANITALGGVARPQRISLAAPGSVYLVVFGVFGAGTCSAVGFIQARRAR